MTDSLTALPPFGQMTVLYYWLTYNQILQQTSNLPPNHRNQIRYLLLIPTELFSYSSVRKGVVNRTSSSKKKYFITPFNTEQLGDKKQAPFRRNRKGILGNQQVVVLSYRNYIFGKLPRSTQTLHLAVNEKNLPNQLADLADDLLDLSSREFVNDSPSTFSELQMKVT